MVKNKNNYFKIICMWLMQSVPVVFNFQQKNIFIFGQWLFTQVVIYLAKLQKNQLIYSRQDTPFFYHHTLWEHFRSISVQMHYIIIWWCTVSPSQIKLYGRHIFCLYDLLSTWGKFRYKSFFCVIFYYLVFVFVYA